MHKRYSDLPYSAFSPWSEIAVTCPGCGGAGTVRLERERGTAVFRCPACGLKRETAPGDRFAQVTGQCAATGRRFRVFVPREKLRGPKQRVKCPFCGEWVAGEAAAPKKTGSLVLEEVRRAEDPYFHYPLYFQGDFRGKRVWALNRQHLDYLIEYLSAELRAVPADYYRRYGTMRTQADHLPAFMKAAKNRKSLVKLLRKLQEK